MIPKIYNEKELPKNIQHPYNFTEALLKFGFNIYELRVIVRIIAMIKSLQKRNAAIQIDIENNVELTFPVSSFMLSGSKNNDDIRKAIIQLREKTITNESSMEIEINGVIETISADEFLGIIERPKWANNNSFVSLKLNESWFRYLGDLSRGYTQYVGDVAFNCTSPEIVKMYLFINQWFKSKGKKLKWINFKKEFQISKSYNTHKIVHRFLIPAKTELDNIADRSFNYTITYVDGSEYDVNNPIKGKRIDMIVFKFYTNFKNKGLYELKDYEHAQAEKWIKSIKNRYKLTEIDIKIIYTLIKKYSLPYFITTERDHRKSLRSKTSTKFLDAIAAIIRSKD